MYISGKSIKTVHSYSFDEKSLLELVGYLNKTHSQKFLSIDVCRMNIYTNKLKQNITYANILREEEGYKLVMDVF